MLQAFAFIHNRDQVTSLFFHDFIQTYNILWLYSLPISLHYYPLPLTKPLLLPKSSSYLPSPFLSSLSLCVSLHLILGYLHEHEWGHYLNKGTY